MAVVCTGGEPLLQMDDELVQYMHKAGIYIAIESNGTIKAPKGIDWICVSPKGDATLNQISGDELKLVYPQIENTPNDFQELDFKHFTSNHSMILNGLKIQNHLLNLLKTTLSGS